MLLSDKIFRAYDIRGKAFEDYDAEGFYCIAKAFAIYEKEKWQTENLKVFVSSDGRQSQEELFPAVVAGLKSAGCEVVSGGEIPTPMNYFAFHEGGFEASIQLSASHNPWYDNGLKLHDRSGSVCGEEIQKIKEIAKQQSPEGIGVLDNGGYEHFAKYLQKLRSLVGTQEKKKIVVDAGNGITGRWYPEILEKMGHEVVHLYCELDTTFPNHQPDPEESENLEHCRSKVLEIEADLGVAYDGDGDRVGIILSDGTCLNADKISYVLATDFLSRNPGGKIIYDIMTSSVLIQKVKELGGVPIQCPTGHSYIEEFMKSENAMLGGEQSGHFMFGENFYGHDDAMVATLRFISAMEANASLLDQVKEGWTKLHEYAEKFVVPDEEKFQILEKFVQEVKARYPEANTVDGIRIDYGDLEWAIVRCSNTSPKISMRIEAQDENSLQEKKDELVGILKELMQ